MNVAVVGAGINGIMTAWALARRGCRVTVYDRGEVMGATSSASTKLLHGGLRYLEHGKFALVREALRERSWWIQQAPHLAHPLQILVPVFRHSQRGRARIRLGLALYDLLAGVRSLGPTRWLNPAAVIAHLPALRSSGLIGAYAFYDGQMDDHALGLWAAQQAESAGVHILPGTEVVRLSAHGEVVLADGTSRRFDRLLNATGPWAGRLSSSSGIRSRYEIHPVRGSHLLISRAVRIGVLLEMPGSERIGFVLPYQGNTLIGTTEVRQSIDEPVVCSNEESDCLTAFFNNYFEPPLSEAEIVSRFAGLRPLLSFSGNPASASREASLERIGVLVNIFGGKWTTSRALAQRAAELALS